jgi:LacI family transcriptional regulator
MPIAHRLKIATEAAIPIVVQLTEQLTWLIASGMIREGEKLPPIRELAEELGIHMHTVREAYHRLEAAHLVSVRTRAGTTVLPFDTQAQAGMQKDTRSFLIGVLMPAPAAVYVPFMHGIQDGAAPYAWMPLMAFTQDNPFLTERYTHQLIAKGVDGLIVTSPGEIERFNQVVESRHLPPIVYADAPHIHQNSVSPDTEGAANAVTRHLIEHGHTRIGLITAPLDWENVAPCYAGYCRALEQSGLELDPEIIAEVPDFEPSSGFEGAAMLMAHRKRPEAIFVSADDLAFGALEAFKELNLRVPEDVAIASFGDVEYASSSHPALTTSHLPAYEMGFEAVKRLQALFSGAVAAHAPLFLDCPLVTRESCGCNPIVESIRGEP